MTRRAELPFLLAAAPFLVLVGAAAALAGIAVHAKAWPWLVLAVAAPLVTAYAAPAGLLRNCFVGGWFAMLLLAVAGRPEGDFAITDSLDGYALLLTGLGLVSYAGVTTLIGWRGERQA